LAAGQGKRMKSNLPKVMHQVCGKPMLLYVLEACSAVGAERTVVVLGHGADQVRPHLPEGCRVAIQQTQLGTGHALLAAADELLPGFVLVVPGDTPLVTGEALHDLADEHLASGAAATVLTMDLEDPTGYGRIVRDEAGGVVRIVEHRDASADELRLVEVNTGMYVLPVPVALDVLRGVGTDNDQGEIYLTDVIAGLLARGNQVAAVKVSDPSLVLGVNSLVELAQAEEIMCARTNTRRTQ
jgi:bifunctional UDP-N-acetylglucosamine pyrophosphorylase/glucosamine-1-phosphate N-acetyltransferase